jgi:hypothetical protein
MTNESKPSRLAHVPAILAGSAAFIAAVSTLYVNLRDKQQVEAAPAVAAPLEAAAAPAPSASAAAPAAPAAPVAQVGPEPVLLRLERVQVDNDGSVGTTDWSFQVSIDGTPFYSVPMPALSDEPGENLARPGDPQAASVQLELPREKLAQLQVNGWKKGWLPGSRAEVSGSTPLGAGLREAIVTVQTEKPKGPKFVLYFSLSPAR